MKINLQQKAVLATLACVMMSLHATTLKEETVECGLCGTPTTVKVITSTSSFGAPDLDGRPAPPARFNYMYLLQYCSKCCYCGWNLKEHPVQVLTLRCLQEHEYKFQQALKNKNLAYLYHVAASIAAVEHPDTDDAVRLELCAAWFCDDENNNAQAVEYRKRTLRHVQRLLEKKETPELLLLKVDLLRRTKQFTEAANAAKRLAEELPNTPEQIRSCAKLEIKLANNNDDKSHSILWKKED